MLIKEFDLDAPKETKELRHRFRMETRCVTALYQRLFVAPQGTGKIWKLLIEGVPEVRKPAVRDLLGALTVEYVFDVASFFKLLPAEKKAAALDLLEGGIERICQYAEWDAAPFRAASRAVRRCGFENEWTWRKPHRKPGSSIRAEVFCQHDIDAFRIYFRISTGQSKERMLIPITSVLPTEFVFVEYLGKAGWDRDRFKLVARNGKLVGEIAINDDGSCRRIL